MIRNLIVLYRAFYPILSDLLTSSVGALSSKTLAKIMDDHQFALCVEFCSVTGMTEEDMSLAQFYLEDTGWKVEVRKGGNCRI